MSNPAMSEEWFTLQEEDGISLRFKNAPNGNYLGLIPRKDVADYIVSLQNELKFALKETHEMMQSFYGYYSSEFRISTDQPDTEYELRVEQNEKLLGIKSDVSG